MKPLNAFSLILLLLLAIMSNATSVDSLANKILGKQDSREKIFELINFSNKYATSHPLPALNAASKALEISFRFKDKRGEAYSYSSLGTLNYNSKNFVKAIEYFEKSVKLFVEIGDKKGEAYALKYLGFAHQKQENYLKAIEYYDSYERVKTSKSRSDETKVKVNKAKSYQKTNQTENSVRQAKEIETSSELLSADERIEIYKELGEIFALSSDSLTEKYLNKAVFLDQQQATSNTNMGAYNALSNFYISQDKSQKAFEVEDMKIAKIKGNEDEERQNKVIRGEEWKELSLSYERKGDFLQALNAYKNYMLLYDTLKQQQIADSIEKTNLISNLINNEDRIKALEMSRNAQAEVIVFQRTISIILSCGLLIVFAGLYFLWRVSKQKEISNLKLRFQSLSNRMNPHFIYNSLNSVNLFIAKNQEREANKFLADFSKLMRMVMDNSSRELISLKEEMSVVEKYLALEHNRFGKRFDYKIDVLSSIDLENLWVPPMVIQPYVENAIWHGLRYRDDKGFVEVEIKEKGRFVICTITDNGIGRDNSLKLKTKNQLDHKSAGMKNSFERIEILNKIYKKNLEIVVENAFEDETYPGTKIQLIIPID